MKSYKVITVKQGVIMKDEKFAEKIEALLNEKCNAGWELVDIKYVGGNGFNITAFLVFRC